MDCSSAGQSTTLIRWGSVVRVHSIQPKREQKLFSFFLYIQNIFYNRRYSAVRIKKAAGASLALRKIAEVFLNFAVKNICLCHYPTILYCVDISIKSISVTKSVKNKIFRYFFEKYRYFIDKQPSRVLQLYTELINKYGIR